MCTVLEKTLVATRIVACNSCGCKAFDLVAKNIDFEYGTCTNEFRFVKCKECALVYLQNRPTINSLRTIYPDDYIPHHFNEHLGGLIARVRNFVQAKKVNPIKNYASRDSLIMDIGSGSGELLRIIKQHGDASWQLVGVDFSERAIRNLEKIGIRGVMSRFEELDWQETAPDVVIMNQVIEHLEDPRQAVEAAYRILAPGGVLLIETPSLDGWDAKWFASRYWGGWHTPRHWNLYINETLAHLFTAADFEVVETTYILSPNFWLQSVHHYLSERKFLKRFAVFADVSCFPALVLATALDMLQKLVRGKTSNFRMVGRKPLG